MDFESSSKAQDISISDEMHTIHGVRFDWEDLTDEERSGVLNPDMVNFEDWLAYKESELIKELVDAGWPDPGKSIHTDEQGRRFAPEALEPNPASWKDHIRPGVGWEIGLKYILNRVKPFSPDHFRALILKQIYDIKSEKGSDRDWSILTLGHTIAVANSRAHFGSILFSKKAASNSKKGGEKRAAMLKPKSREIIGEIKRLDSLHDNISLACEFACKNGLGSSPGANRRLWYRWKDKAR